jgi:hypothetical protein
MANAMISQAMQFKSLTPRGLVIALAAPSFRFWPKAHHCKMPAAKPTLLAR